MLLRKTRPVWENFVVGLLVVVSLWLALGIYSRADRVRKQQAMIWELRTMRNWVVAAILENHRRPKSLKNLPVDLPTQDPFGNPYQYNPRDGSIHSTTQGYLNW